MSVGTTYVRGFCNTQTRTMRWIKKFDVYLFICFTLSYKCFYKFHAPQCSGVHVLLVECPCEIYLAAIESRVHGCRMHRFNPLSMSFICFISTNLWLWNGSVFVDRPNWFVVSQRDIMMTLLVISIKVYIGLCMNMRTCEWQYSRCMSYNPMSHTNEISSELK